MIKLRNFKDDIIIEENMVKDMFNLLRDNMIKIIPETFGDYDMNYKIFCENCIKNAVQEYKVKTVIAFNREKAIAYIQYFYDTNSNELCIREIQISKEHQGDHETFCKLIECMTIDSEYRDINKIKGYINNRNQKSRDVFKSIGFKEAYEKNNGKIYTVNREELKKWINRI